mgnify:CR=1 FL=1
MKSESITNGFLSLFAAIALVYLSTTFHYDADDALSTSSFNDTVGPILLFALIFGVNGIYQFYLGFSWKE